MQPNEKEMELFRLIRSPAWLRHDKNGITQRILRATDGQANPETGLLDGMALPEHGFPLRLRVATL